MNLIRFDSERAWVDGVCASWQDRLRENPTQRICLPTGLTPAAIYAEMVRRVRAGQVSFGKASVFALDEFGGLPANEPGLTRNTLLRQLVALVDLAPSAFHALDPDAPDVEGTCRRYDAAIGGGFDLVLLGIGLNGHLGMNEPGTAADSETRRVELHESTRAASARYFPGRDPRELPRWGLTVGLKAILASTEVWVLANGSGKAAIVRRAIAGDVTPDVPASLLQRHPNCSFCVDADAGGAAS
jgi:glucosamine-6-phosphate deaminase